MKPIETGCLAMIVNGNYPENIGRVVKVVNLDPTESELMNQNVWVIESLSEPLKVRTNNHNKEFELRCNSYSLECNLLRIDSDGSTVELFNSAAILDAPICELSDPHLTHKCEYKLHSEERKS